jgi:hypothetical protein
MRKLADLRGKVSFRDANAGMRSSVVISKICVDHTKSENCVELETADDAGNPSDRECGSVMALGLRYDHLGSAMKLDSSGQKPPGTRRVAFGRKTGSRTGRLRRLEGHGRPARGQLPPGAAGDGRRADAAIDWDALRFVAAVSDAGRYGIQDGDVLLPLRSARTAAVVATGVPPGVIAVGHWAIVSP